MKKIVIDTSAIMALLNKEKGFEIVEAHISGAIISTVILSEVITVANRNLFENKQEKEEGLELIKRAFPNIVDFDVEQAIISAALDIDTKKYGLSFGDRACLSLAKTLNLPVLTADRIWGELDLGIEVKLIR